MMVMLPGRERTLKEYKVPLDASGLKFERALPTHSRGRGVWFFKEPNFGALTTSDSTVGYR